MQVFVNTLTGKKITIDVKLSDTVASVKQFIQDTEGIHVDFQNLIYAGKLLKNERTLEDYYVQNNSQLHLLVINKNECR
jgi:ubiquitin